MGGDDGRYGRERERMVEDQLVARGVTDPRVVGALGRVPRHRFVQEALRERAYGDHPLPIGEEQTISQPFIVGLMTSLLELTGREKVLEVGTGSGYQTAVLAELARRVCSIERLPRLAGRGRATRGGGWAGRGAGWGPERGGFKPPPPGPPPPPAGGRPPVGGGETDPS